MRFEDFVLARSPALLRAAYALTSDRGLAEDLVQTALLKTYLHWERVAAADDPYAYTQRILFTSHRRMFRRRRVAEKLGSVVEHDRLGKSDINDDWDGLARALDMLPRGQRAVVVLRYLEDLSIEQTAAILGCSAGTVKSQTARALARLRVSPQLDRKESR